jgi:hypothetical protein
MLRHLTSEAKWGLVFAAIGFAVAAILYASTFYPTSHGHFAELLFLALCPPSIGSIALDNAGVVRGLVGWFFIALMNAALYGGAGIVACTFFQKSRQSRG